MTEDRKDVRVLKWLDLFLVARTWEVNSAVMGFELFEAGDSGDGAAIFSTGCGHPTREIDQATCAFEGDVKFDGCCNWQSVDGMAHICDLQEMAQLTAAFGRLYEHARERGILTA